MWIAMLQHSPEDTAVGVGATPEAAAHALIAAYPNGAGRELDIAEIQLGGGFAAIEEASPLRRAFGEARQPLPGGAMRW